MLLLLLLLLLASPDPESRNMVYQPKNALLEEYTLFRWLSDAIRCGKDGVLFYGRSLIQQTPLQRVFWKRLGQIVVFGNQTSIVAAQKCNNFGRILYINIRRNIIYYKTLSSF